MSYRRPYYQYDANLKLVGTIWLDLTDPLAHCRVIFEDDLTRPGGSVYQATRSRVTEEIRAGNVDAGVFPAGEHPGDRRRQYRLVTPQEPFVYRSKNG